MGLSRSIGSLVVRIVADGLGAYKADLNTVADATEKAAGKIDKGAKLAGTAAGAMSGGMAEAATAAQELHGAAGLAGVGLGALAVGAAATAYAVYKGAQEQVAYQKALTLTGNYAGTTAGQMADMARNIGQNVGTTYQASDALVAMAGTGRVMGADLQRASQVAVQAQQALGVSVQDTAQEFAKLSGDPVKASLALNESMHYLTASTYAQIKAAEDMGDEERAASLAQVAYADAMGERTAQVLENLGYLEKAWKGLRGAVVETWDAMLGLGREDTLQQKIDALKEGISEAKSSGSGADSTGKPLAALEAELVYMQRMAASQQSMAVHMADRVQREEASIALAEKADKFASRQVQMQREIAQAKAQLENSNLSAADYANYEQAVVGIANRFKETATAARTAKAGISEAEKALKAAAKAEADWQKEASKAYEDTINAREKSAGSVQQELEKQLEHNAAIGMSVTALAELQAEKLNDQAISKESLALLADQIDWSGRLGAAYRREAQDLRDLAYAKVSGAQKQVGADAAKDMAAEQKKAAEASGKYWEDALMRAFESGKGFFQSLWDTIKNTLKTQVLKVTVQGVMGTLGIGAAGAASASVGSGTDLLGLANTASTLSNLYSAGSSIVSIGGQVAAGTMGIANALGTMAANATGTGITGLLATNGAYGTAAAGTASAAAGSATAGLAAIPGWGWAAMAAIAVLSMGSDKVASRSTGGTQSTYDATGKRIGYNPYYDTRDGTTPQADAMVQSLQDSYMATAKALGIEAAKTTFIYAGNTGKNSADPQFYLGGSAGGSTFYQNQTRVSDAAVSLAASRAVLAALKGSGLPEYLSGVFDGLTVSTASQDQINAVMANAQALTTLNKALEALNFDNLAKLSYTATQSLLAAAGGVDSFSNALAAYYQTFYSDAERLVVTTANVGKVFAELAIEMPASKAAFRDLMEGLDLTTTKGQTAYAALLNVAPTFASVADAVSNMTNSLVSEVKRIRGLMAGDTPASYAQAQTAFAIGTEQARAGDSTALAALPTLSQSLLTLAESNAATSTDLARVRALTASSLEATASAVAGAYGMGRLPSFAVGTNYVPRDMVARIHEGEAITPRAYNPAADGRGAGGSDQAALLAELRAMREDNAKMRAELRAIALHSAKTAKLLSRVTRDGESMQTVAAT